MPRQSQLKVIRRPERFLADKRRVITRPFLPATEEHLKSVLDRVLGLSGADVSELLSEVVADFSTRHRDITAAFEAHYDMVREHLDGRPVSDEQRLLIGAYFTKEYAIEAAALFNPSMVPHPDQSGLSPGECRIIVSLRATGEGHISSIGFRSGVIDSAGEITIDPAGRYVTTPEIISAPIFDKHTFDLKLSEMGIHNDVTEIVLEGLPPQFTGEDLGQGIDNLRRRGLTPADFRKTVDAIKWLAHSNYVAVFPPDCPMSERVIFPVSENESRGIEDARFIRFVDDDGTVTYYATCTAFNGFEVLPQMIATPDFRSFRISTLNGKYAANKGMALFPRKLAGSYASISRFDGENLYLLKSDNIDFWNTAKKIRGPQYPWEFFQIGNCGSPIETDEGWLLLNHGVGPMRRYTIGIDLLDKEDPSQVIARLDEPILVPEEQERDGYVPNVTYSCGAMIHNRQLIIPYAMSDSVAGIATLSLPELMAQLSRSRNRT
ncbi:MAG: glycoside hydrolase family 130 protein [Planctomycetes bacterium]|nr:glycoside hydrolase family 130 protein [Planctomycetota bacterium]